MSGKYGSLSPTKMPKKIMKRSIIVDLLSVLFGISSWIEINGLWVEMPLLVERLPEKWNLPSYIAIFTQVANVGPILYSIARKKWSFKVIEKPVIHVTLAIGTVSCFLLVFLWSETSFFLGRLQSTALLSLGFCLALVDCTSSVLYLPFMANYKGKYVISYLIGEGMSGLLPGIVALIQGVGGNTKCKEVNYTNVENDTVIKREQYYEQPLFSVEVFFGFLFVMMLISWIAFVLLQTLRRAKMEMVAPSNELATVVANKSNDKFESQVETCSISKECCRSSKYSVNDPAMEKKLNKRIFATLLIYQSTCCALTNGILPSIQTYSCLPYGNKAYHLTVTLTSIANPVSCFLAMLLPSTTITGISIYFSAGLVCSCYLITTAVYSPLPPLVGTTEGEVLIVVMWILFVALLTYAKACMTAILHQGGGHHALFWSGAVSQIGSACGALLMFLIVNFSKAFQDYDVCAS